MSIWGPEETELLTLPLWPLPFFLFWFRWWLAFLPFEFGIVLEDEVFVMISGYRGVPRQGIDLQLFHAKKYGVNLSIFGFQLRLGGVWRVAKNVSNCLMQALGTPLETCIYWVGLSASEAIILCNTRGSA